jgi:hypothetical protein
MRYLKFWNTRTFFLVLSLSLGVWSIVQQDLVSVHVEFILGICDILICPDWAQLAIGFIEFSWALWSRRAARRLPFLCHGE